MAKRLIDRVPFTPGDLTDHQHGTDEILTGVDFSTNILIGDAGGSMFDHSKGGDNTLIGGVLSNTMYGDPVANMSGHAQGGNDTFSHRNGFVAAGNTVYGDAGGDMQGGNDSFVAAVAQFSSNTFYGDAGGNMSGHAQPTAAWHIPRSRRRDKIGEGALQ